MRRLLVAALAAGITLAPGAAWADHDGGGYYEGGDRDQNRGGGECRGAEGTCEDNDFSPSFDKSPVDDSFIFAPVICLPGSTCHVDGSRGQGDGGNGGQPTRS